MAHSPYATKTTRSVNKHDDVGFDAGLQTFFTMTYKKMMLAMILTGIISYLFGQDLAAMIDGKQTSIIPKEILSALFLTPLKWVVMLAPLGFALIFGATVHRLSAQAARLWFYAFAAVMGLSISTIFVIYSGVSIAQTFFATATAFAGLSLYGYTTKRDLGPIGKFLFMGLIGLIALSLLNLFIQSDPMSMALSAVAIFIFAGLTAYDTQKLKVSYISMRQEGATDDDLERVSTIGAFELYLDFLNLFLSLLRFIGAARD
jgi:hypothetical protein